MKAAKGRWADMLVTWDDLDEEVREWDRVAVRGIPAFLARAGFQVMRLRPLGYRPDGPSSESSGQYDIA